LNQFISEASAPLKFSARWLFALLASRTILTKIFLKKFFRACVIAVSKKNITNTGKNRAKQNNFTLTFDFFGCKPIVVSALQRLGQCYSAVPIRPFRF